MDGTSDYTSVCGHIHLLSTLRSISLSLAKWWSQSFAPGEPIAGGLGTQAGPVGSDPSR